MRSNLLYAIAAIAALAAFDARAQELKLASWNIGNLASKPGVPLRGHARDEAEYQHIRDIFAKLGPDIIALQEMGSMGSARAVVGDSYNIVFEERCMNNSAHCDEDVDDIFTAIACKKSLGQLAEVQVPQLSVMHTSDAPTKHRDPSAEGSE